MLKHIFTITLGLSIFFAYTLARSQTTVLTDTALAKDLNLSMIAADDVTGVSLALLPEEKTEELIELAHEYGKCGGFEPVDTVSIMAASILDELRQLTLREQQYYSTFKQVPVRPKNDAILSALEQVDPANLKQSVEWLSGFHTRYHRSSTPNTHVAELEKRIKEITADVGFPVTIERVSHTRTPQQSLVVRLLGSQQSDQIIVLGGHLDSINGRFGGSNKAPGADDNASGSSNLLEALRILAQQDQPQRTIEFMWYAGEEAGLLGSSEIAASYRNQNKDVIAVLQLDMTLHPGEGPFVIASMTDFTSSWLRDYLVALNDTYIGAKIVEDRCGYGCSDHASWHRQSYPTLMPFEATMRSMNRMIHTTSDTINSRSNFEHSAVFTKIAVALALDLGNSDLRQPY